ncbi:hypothetical protein C8R43DRAFT_928315 [Mycena crocata]|nr:hypothetical protein C8R43DRAFT_928315 [Mycena crocata]
MHDCLTKQDVLGEICCTLDPSCHEDMCSLTALAQTCTTFHHPALHVLWRWTPIEKLLRCLPKDLLVVETVNGGSPRMRLLRPVLLEDWDRARLHARHIRTIHVDSLVSSDPVLPTIGRCLPKDLFFNLRNICCDALGLSLMPRLVGPSLEKLDISLTKDCLVPALSTIVTKCPRLKVLGVDGSATSIASLAPLLEPSLPPVQGVTPAFTVPTSLNGLPLTYLILVFSDPPTASAAASFLTTLVATGCHTILTSLELSAYNSHMPTDSRPMSSEELRPLFCFVNLVTVRLELTGCDLDDATVLDMARAWGRIKDLRLMASSYEWPAEPMRPRTTLNCLRSFAEYCPHLAYLEMSIDASHIPILGRVSEELQSSHPLSKLSVPFSPITESLPVWEFLSALFPKITSITTERMDNNEDESLMYGEAIAYDNLWAEVVFTAKFFRYLSDKNK